MYKGSDQGQNVLFKKCGGARAHRLSTSNEDQIDGIIAHVGNKEVAKTLIPKGCPAVVVPADELVPDLPNLIGDGDRAGQLAAEYLKSLGLRNFAFCGYDANYWSRERFRGFQKVMRKDGHDLNVFNQKKHRSRRLWENELGDIAGWLQSLPTPVGVWVWNDDLAQYVVEAARIAGLLVPDQISVLGVDDDELVCNMCDPPLSSLALNCERAGYEMAELLHKLMKGRKTRNSNVILHSGSITVRQSTNVLAIEDKDVAQALRYIYANAQKPIQVEDVVNAVPLSRRYLYERFQRAVGCSVYTEIMRVRGDRIARLLVDTNSPISKIAVDMGFQGVEHISRFFKKTKGMSPRQYRLKYGQR
jgi:LacI family transcriptional regulator